MFGKSGTLRSPFCIRLKMLGTDWVTLQYPQRKGQVLKRWWPSFAEKMFCWQHEDILTFVPGCRSITPVRIHGKETGVRSWLSKWLHQTVPSNQTSSKNNLYCWTSCYESFCYNIIGSIHNLWLKFGGIDLRGWSKSNSHPLKIWSNLSTPPLNFPSVNDHPINSSSHARNKSKADWPHLRDDQHQVITLLLDV